MGFLQWLLRRNLTERQIKEYQDKWYIINQPTGKALGYPDCCVKAFCDNAPEIMEVYGLSEEDHVRHEAAFMNGEYTGFIPCRAHAKQIIAGEVKIQDLIKNRSENYYPFPSEFRVI